jgi:hypothetical protein
MKKELVDIARLFTRDERSRVKHKYHRRKMIWDFILSLAYGGLAAQVVIYQNGLYG